MIYRIIFSTLLIILIIVAFVLILYTPLKHHLQRKFTVTSIGRKVYKLAVDYDYLLVQNFSFRLDENKSATFHHLLFGDKFFYCIVDRVYIGGITGSYKDESIINYKSSKSDEYSLVPNPIVSNQRRVEKFSLVSGIEREDLISIVLVNDDCLISEKLDVRNGRDFIIHISDLPKLIKEIASRHIGKINSKQIENVVREKILRMNINYKEKRKK